MRPGRRARPRRGGPTSRGGARTARRRACRRAAGRASPCRRATTRAPGGGARGRTAIRRRRSPRRGRRSTPRWRRRGSGSTPRAARATADRDLDGGRDAAPESRVRSRGRTTTDGRRQRRGEPGRSDAGRVRAWSSPPPRKRGRRTALHDRCHVPGRCANRAPGADRPGLRVGGLSASDRTRNDRRRTSDGLPGWSPGASERAGEAAARAREVGWTAGLESGRVRTRG